MEVEARTDWSIAPTSVACQEVGYRRKVRQRATYRSPFNWFSDASSDPRTPAVVTLGNGAKRGFPTWEPMAAWLSGHRHLPELNALEANRRQQHGRHLFTNGTTN